MSASQVIALRPDTDEPTPAELQAAARDAYLQAAATGEAPTGAQLGHQFNRSDRWGRDRIAEARGTNHRIVPGHPVDATDATDTAADSRRRTGLFEAERTDTGTAHSGGEVTVASDIPEPTEYSAGRHATAGSSPVGGASPAPGAWSRRLIRWITTAAVIVVAACAARSSYEHQRTVVEIAGEHRSAWYLPLSVDGMMLIASLNMLVRRWDGERAGWLTWIALLLGGAASLAANIAAAEPTWIGRLVAAWSPICLIVSYELLMQQLPNQTDEEPAHR
jgi:Protein of unknown function (DUF2637)